MSIVSTATKKRMYDLAEEILSEERQNREAEAKSWKQRPAGELGLCSMVNVSKSLLNVVSGNQAKVADKPEPKGVQSDVLL